MKFCYSIVLLSCALLCGSVTLSYGQTLPQPGQCLSEECNSRYRADLERVNEDLRQALVKVNQTLADQKRLIDQWKTCKINNSTSPEYMVEFLASVEPCITPRGDQRIKEDSRIQGVTQLDGKLYVICKNSMLMRVYDAATLQGPSYIQLPSQIPANYTPQYIIANRYEKTLYLAINKGFIPGTENYYSGYDIWRTSDMTSAFIWGQLSSAKEDKTFNIQRLRVSRNGQMMYANTTHILFPQSATSFSRSIYFGKAPLGPLYYILGIVEAKNGSFVMYTQMKQNYLVRVSATGDFVGNVGDGPISPTTETLSSMMDAEEGPDEQIFISQYAQDRIVILDPIRNRNVELISRQAGNFWGPNYLSYDPQTQILALSENPMSTLRGTPDSNDRTRNLKVFRVKPKV